MAAIIGFSQTWQVLPNSPIMTEFEENYTNHDDLEFCDDNTGFICNIGGSVSRTLDGGDSWKKVFDSPGTSFRCIAFINCDTGYVGTLGRGSWVTNTTDRTLMYKTYDGGDSWSEVTTIPTGGNPRGICGLQAIDGKNIVGVGRYDGPSFFYKSTDGGVSWTTKDVGAAENCGGLVDVHFFNPTSGIITGRTTTGESRVWSTTDGGDNWDVVATAEDDHAWKVFFVNDQIGYFSVSNYNYPEKYYYYTTDGGHNWDQQQFADGSYQGRYYNKGYEALGIGFLTEDIGWIGGDFTTMQTMDGGQTFTEIQIDPTYDDNINRFVKTDNFMYAVGTRVYKFTIEVGAADQPDVDNTLCDISISPNPITGTAQITYTVPEDDRVMIHITSIGGRAVECLVNKDQKAGTYTIDYTPDYKLKFVHCTFRSGRYRKTVNILRDMNVH